MYHESKSRHEIADEVINLMPGAFVFSEPKPTTGGRPGYHRASVRPYELATFFGCDKNPIKATKAAKYNLFHYLHTLSRFFAFFKMGKLVIFSILFLRHFSISISRSLFYFYFHPNLSPPPPPLQRKHPNATLRSYSANCSNGTRITTTTARTLRGRSFATWSTRRTRGRVCSTSRSASSSTAW